MHLLIRTVVRLGEHHLETDPDCQGLQCAPPTQNFTPTDIIIHPDFDTRVSVSDDIALIRLDRKVKLGGKCGEKLVCLAFVQC